MLVKVSTSGPIGLRLTPGESTSDEVPPTVGQIQCTSDHNIVHTVLRFLLISYRSSVDEVY
jgi:hypothetical protein